jgi:hypothetical protein
MSAKYLLRTSWPCSWQKIKKVNRVSAMVDFVIAPLLGTMRKLQVSKMKATIEPRASMFLFPISIA